MDWRLQQAGHASVGIILTPATVTSTGTRGIMHLIEHVRGQEAAGRRERDRARIRANESLLAAGIKRQTAEQQRLQQELQASVERNPFGNVSVPPRRSLLLSAGGELVTCELPPAAHCGVVVQVKWWSLKKYSYLEPFWSCCGMRGTERARGQLLQSETSSDERPQRACKSQEALRSVMERRTHGKWNTPGQCACCGEGKLCTPPFHPSGQCVCRAAGQTCVQGSCECLPDDGVESIFDFSCGNKHTHDLRPRDHPSSSCSFCLD